MPKITILKNGLILLCVLICMLSAFSLRAGEHEREPLSDAGRSGVMNMPAATLISDEECARMRDKLGYTEYYCECLNHGLPFRYGMDTLIQGINWWTATLNDVSQGFSAYWFAPSSVLLEGFVDCAQDSATLSQRIGANRSYHADLQTMLGRFGGTGGIGALADLDLHVRTTQTIDPQGREGRLIVTPYDKGPHSTCEKPLPIYYNMPYVISDTDNVYMLLPNSGPSVNGQALRWVCKYGDSVEVSVGRGSCDAAPFMHRTLRDSLHVWVLPYDTLRNYRRDTLYFHFHTTTRLAEAWFIRPLQIENDTVDTVTCLGSVLSFNGIRCNRDTAFADTVYLEYDTVNYTRRLQATAFTMQFNPPVPEYDTINCHDDSLKFYYYGEYINRFGDYSIYYRRPGQCDRDIRLHVEEILYPEYVNTDTTLCEGMILRVNRVDYTRDTVFSVSTWRGKQEVITTWRVHFTPPVLTRDTVRCHYDSLPFSYRGQRITAFGNKTLTIKAYNTCTEKVALTTIQLWYNDTVTRDTTLCQGGAFVLKNAESLGNDKYVVRWADKQTKHVVYYNVQRTSPMLEYDSLLLHITRMPYNYFGHVLTHYGDTLLEVTEGTDCDRLVQLHTEEYIFPITYDSTFVDTTFCEGMSYRLHDSLYTASTQFVDTFWLAEYEVMYTHCRITVLPPEAEYDTLHILASSLPLTYEGREILSFGSHVVRTHEDGVCDRLVYLELKETAVVFDTTRFDTTLCTGEILYVADTVVFRPVLFYRRVWSAALDTCYVSEYDIMFVNEPVHYDTISAYFSEMPYHYAAYPGGRNISDFGEHSYTYEPVNACREVFSVYIMQRWARDTVVYTDTVCAGSPRQGYSVQEPVNIRQADSVHIYI